MLASQIGSCAALPGPLPISAAKSGAVYALSGVPAIAAPAAVTPVGNQVVYVPIFVPFAISVSRLGVLYGTTGSGLRQALYAVGSDGLPGALIADFGIINNSTSLSSSAIASPPSLTRGWVYAAINGPTGQSTTLYGYAPSAVPELAHAGLLPVIATSTSGLAFLNAATQTNGAFPATATAPTTSFANFPIPLLQAA